MTCCLDINPAALPQQAALSFYRREFAVALATSAAMLPFAGLPVSAAPTTISKRPIPAGGELILSSAWAHGLPSMSVHPSDSAKSAHTSFKAYSTTAAQWWIPRPCAALIRQLQLSGRIVEQETPR